MPRRRPAGELAVDVALSGSRCFEGEDVTITATVRAPPSAGRADGGRPLDEITIQLEPAPQVTLAAGDHESPGPRGTGPRPCLRAGGASGRGGCRPSRRG